MIKRTYDFTSYRNCWVGILCSRHWFTTAAGGKGLFEGMMPAALLSPLAAENPRPLIEVLGRVGWFKSKMGLHPAHRRSLTSCRWYVLPSTRKWTQPNDMWPVRSWKEQHGRSAQSSGSGGARGISYSRASTCFLNHLFSEPYKVLKKTGAISVFRAKSFVLLPVRISLWNRTGNGEMLQRRLPLFRNKEWTDSYV